MAVQIAEIDKDVVPESIEIRPLAITIGAEISGVDLSKPLSNQEITEIRTAFLKWKVVFFRDQPLDHAQQVAFSRQFAPVPRPTRSMVTKTTPFRVYSVDRDRRDKRYKGEDLRLPWSGWHADVTPAINPPVSILRGDSFWRRHAIHRFSSKRL